MILLLKAKAGHHLAFFNRPSDAQIAAGNYPKQHRKFQGLDITIENPRGSHRTGKKPDGTDWVTSMAHDYGYIKGTLGVDGDHFDCFVGPQGDASHAYIVTTKRPPDFKAVDEQKAMLGFPHEDAARAAFLQHYDDPRFLGSIKPMPMEQFRRELRTSRERPRLIKSLIFLGKPV